ncbi:putative membrane-associated kinase regulator 4 [Primulina tabacum]|uniref:putative membrane-associated kinase regulator 4 n=1 Tax=Primulina tabacum TaxID=48773 RepID=UPI003F5A79D2
MAINLALYESEEEDYIEMEMTSLPSNSLHVTANSSPQSQEFEFQMPSTSNSTQPTISTADELFYNGKILPLHLTLRRKMVQDILLHHDAAAAPVEVAKQPLLEDGDNFTLPLDSCRESCEMDLDDCLFEWPVEFTGFINNHPTKRSWSKKLKLIKNSILVQKLKFFFNKSAGAVTDESSCAKANPNSEPRYLPKTEECSNKLTTIAKKKPFGFIGKETNQTADAVTKINTDKGVEENVCRKSVSDAKNQNSPVEFLSSSSSSSSVLKRSSSATEIEGSIEAAIYHCKNSQQILDKFLDCYRIDL